MSSSTSDQRKIDGLSRMTVQNGATVSEEKSAKRIIAQIQNRIKLTGLSEPDLKLSEIDQIDNYSRAFEDGSIDNKILDVDWDIIAKNLLSAKSYFDYIRLTEAYWVQYMSYLHGISLDGKKKDYINRDQYRRKCRAAFYRLKDT